MGLVNGNLTARAQFPPIGTSEQSDECYRLIKEGVVTGTSIGFVPKKWEFRDLESGYGILFNEVECIEYSFVSVPAQAEAMIIGKSWRGAALAERPTPTLSVMQYSGTARERRWQLAHALRQLLREDDTSTRRPHRLQHSNFATPCTAPGDVRPDAGDTPGPMAIAAARPFAMRHEGRRVPDSRRCPPTIRRP
jgi:hypothetical protein